MNLTKCWVSNPREFWIAEGRHTGDWDIANPFYQTCLTEKPDDEDTHNNLVHVVEYSAYKKLLDKLKELGVDVESN